MRICGEIGTGETPSATQITDGAEALNDLCKEWQADGMPLWKVTQAGPFTFTNTVNTYLIGTGAAGTDFVNVSPLKILQAWRRKVAAAPNDFDTPMLIVPKEDYLYLGQKTATGFPNQLVYTPPGANKTGSVSEMSGQIIVFPTPDTTTATTSQLWILGQFPYEDFSATGDVPDFPSYWFNAIKWGLAAELCYEYGTAYAERSMIMKQAMFHKDVALSFGTEEGSLWIQPRPQWSAERY
jgi:hypothetical protein